MSLSKLKWGAIFSFIIAMAILLLGGYAAQRQLPPYPGKIFSPEGKMLFTKEDILAGQDVYQRYGLMDHGSVWGHGSQRGPEFSATTLHLIGETIRNFFALQEYGQPYGQINSLQKELIDVKVRKEIKTNRYDPGSDTLTLSPPQIKALENVHQFWEKTFKEGDKRYGFLPQTVPNAEERKQISGSEKLQKETVRKETETGKQANKEEKKSKKDTEDS
ncbi:MAG: hypothetical protein ACP5Q3_11410, partial [bacterium]